MKITPENPYISPGLVKFATTKEVVTEYWMWGEEFSTTEVLIEEYPLMVPEPEVNHQSYFEFAGKTFVVTRDDDVEYWGHPGSKAGILAQYWEANLEKLRDLEQQGVLELGEDRLPVAPSRVFSRAALELENKRLMAHVMVDMGVFKSVGDARRNGWDRPLELGQFVVTKKKLRFRIVE